MGPSSSDTEDFGDIDDDDFILAASQTETLISNQRSPLQELSSNRTWTPPSEDFGDIDDDDLILAASQTESLIFNKRSPLQELSSNQTWMPPSSHSQSAPGPKLTRAPPTSSQPRPTSSQSQPQPVVRAQASSPYRFTFGTYQGQKVDEVPYGYIVILRKKGVLGGIPALKAAVEEMERQKQQRQAALRASVEQQEVARRAEQQEAALSAEQQEATLGASVEQQKAALRASITLSTSQVAAPIVVAPPAPPAPPPFRFPFARHKGKTLSEVPLDYLLGVKAQGLMDDVPGFAAALELFENPPATTAPILSAPAPSSSTNRSSFPPSSSLTSPPTPSSSAPTSSCPPSSAQVYAPAPSSSAPTSSLPPSSSQIPAPALQNVSTNRSTFRNHTGNPLVEVPREHLTFLKDCDFISSKPDLAATMLDVERQNPLLSSPPDPSQYVLNFSIYKGMQLDAVPPTFIKWLRDERVEIGRPDLAAALNHFERKNKQIQKENARKGGTSSRPSNPFQVPSDLTNDVHRFFRNGEQMWITASDARGFFGAETQALLAAGVKAMSGTRSKKGTRFWLHQVFYFAKHFKTTGSDTPSKALNKFKAKNHRVSETSIPQSSRYSRFR